MKYHRHLLCVLLIVSVSCGRKQKTIFQFPDKEPIKINRIAIPAVRGIQLQQCKHGVQLSWYALSEQEAFHELPQELTFSGYHVYRLTRSYFVPKQPLTKKPITELVFLDRHATKRGKRYSYVVRGVFALENRVILGPTSRMAGIKIT